VDAGEGLGGGPVLDLPAVGPPPERDGDG
jgi:hypothetical protein